jgi:hypothetical protein
VVVETRLRAGPSRVRIAAVKDVLFSKSSVPGLGHTQPPLQWVPGFFSGAECVVDRSRLSSAEVKNEWSYTSALPVHLHGVGRDKFNYLACFLPEKSISMVPTLELTFGVQVVALGLFHP